jgi:hypothetical protein
VLILPDHSPGSLTLLREAIRDRFRITMLVIGDNSGQDVIASKADVRAQAMASTRRVVWIRDPDLLTSSERNQYTQNGASIACVLDLEDRPVVWLTANEASSFTSLELAFAQAQQSGSLT